ncbi:hypothetical protein [Microbacterium stercoris]|uniref:Uncharacterized protein n=1 Tax=Microbacterium stercoris TaxID=2820289 RepID=A0A939QRI5_9MICO|nr:hypothetical protein [Microbacterium stercoris]MBO3663743.1 hypothetical protein [Microbacterium stercoris]
MATYTYLGTLTDVGVHGLADFMPRLTVRPEVEAWGPDGLVTDQRVVVPVTGTTFSMELIPSSELVGTNGKVGVQYILEVVLYGETASGGRWRVWQNEWRFSALPGGGAITRMGDVPALGFYVGPNWPATPLPGAYYDPSSGDLGYYAIGVN